MKKRKVRELALYDFCKYHLCKFCEKIVLSFQRLRNRTRMSFFFFGAVSITISHSNDHWYRILKILKNCHFLNIFFCFELPFVFFISSIESLYERPCEWLGWRFTGGSKWYGGGLSWLSIFNVGDVVVFFVGKLKFWNMFDNSFSISVFFSR